MSDPTKVLTVRVPVKDAATIILVPVTLREAKRFVNGEHRHNEAPVGWAFGVGIKKDGELVGVAMAGRPSARKLQAADPYLIEITRITTLGHKNACTMLYGAVCRAAKALGYRTAITYTLPEEGGASVRAAGFVLDAELPDPGPWSSPSRPRYEETLLGPRKHPSGPKIRWRRELVPLHLALRDAVDAVKEEK